MFYLNVSLSLKREDELERFLLFVSNLDGVDVVGDPVLHSLNTRKLAWLSLESRSLGVAGLKKELRKLPKAKWFEVSVYDQFEHEHTGERHDRQMAR